MHSPPKTMQVSVVVQNKKLLAQQTREVICQKHFEWPDQLLKRQESLIRHSFPSRYLLGGNTRAASQSLHTSREEMALSTPAQFESAVQEFNQSEHLQSRSDALLLSSQRPTIQQQQQQQRSLVFARRSSTFRGEAQKWDRLLPQQKNISFMLRGRKQTSRMRLRLRNSVGDFVAISPKHNHLSQLKKSNTRNSSLAEFMPLPLNEMQQSVKIEFQGAPNANSSFVRFNEINNSIQNLDPKKQITQRFLQLQSNLRSPEANLSAQNSCKKMPHSIIMYKKALLQLQKRQLSQSQDALLKSPDSQQKRLKKQATNNNIVSHGNAQQRPASALRSNAPAKTVERTTSLQTKINSQNTHYQNNEIDLSHHPILKAQQKRLRKLTSERYCVTARDELQAIKTQQQILNTQNARTQPALLNSIHRQLYTLIVQ